VPKKKEESENCEIEVRQTKSGRRIKFKGKCSPAQIEVAKEKLEDGNSMS